MAKWRTKLYKTDRARDFDHERDRQVRARQVYETIDRQRFQWVVVLAAGIGFFLDGYTLFASNFAMPMLAYVYWGKENSHTKLTWINIATLVGTMVGQVLFGVLADKKGRRRMYGVELVILIVATLGVVMSSNGVSPDGTNHSMNVYAWLLLWRFITGVGVGADCPLSAVITSEFAPTAHRARMMAAVFAMQPLGQTAATIATMIVASIARRTVGEEDLIRAADIMWRWIIGIGVFPGVLAILFRFAIPETPRFMLEIKADPNKAESDTSNLFGEAEDDEELVSPVSSEGGRSGLWLDTKNVPTHNRPPTTISPTGTSHDFYYDDITMLDNMSFYDNSHASVLTTGDWTLATPAPPTLNSKWSVARADMYQFFIKEKNYITLLVTSLTWLFLDIGFCGVTMTSPHSLAKIWGDLNIHGRRPPWQTTDDTSVSFYDQFLGTSFHALVILNLGSLAGSALLVLTINHLDRVKLQRYGFLLLAALFVAMGGMFIAGAAHARGPLAVVLCVIVQAAFNFGPNATTYMLPAELFPTRYRATCHGISAASGKFGAALMQVISAAVAHAGRKTLDSQSLQEPHVFDRDARSQRYGIILIGYSGAMILGFVISLWLPRVQKRVEKKKVEKKTSGGWFESRLASLMLEELSLGRQGWRLSGAQQRRGSC